MGYQRLQLLESRSARYLARVADETSLERDVARLYGLPLDEFTSARNELARELKRSGDAAAAEGVRKLEKPTRSAGAINRAVRRKRRDAKRLLDAAAKLGEAQEKLIEGGERRLVDQAVERERAAVDRLMADVEAELGRDGEPSETMLDRARATLHAVATNPELRDELEAGRFTTDHEAVGLGGLVAGGRPRAPRKQRAAERGDARRQVERAERDLEAAERKLERAERAKAQAEERLEAASAALSEAESEVGEATSARDEARSVLKRAR
jgi:exonuclease VII small subunit